jgi:hypothetical protein
MKKKVNLSIWGVYMGKIKEYALSTVLNTSYEDAISKVTDALKEEGLGVLTEIEPFRRWRDPKKLPD